MLGSMLLSCSEEDSVATVPSTPSNPTPQAKMPVIGSPTVNTTFTSFTIAYPAIVYSGTDMRSVKILMDSTSVPSLSNHDFEPIMLNNVSANSNTEYSTTISNTPWSNGKIGSTLNVVLTYEILDGSTTRVLYTPVVQVQLKGYKRGQRYLDTDGLVLAPTNTPLDQIKSIVWSVENNGTSADLLIKEERKDLSMPGLNRPAFDFKGYYAAHPINNEPVDCFSKGTGMANTLRIIAVQPSQVLNGIINPNGAAKLCHNFGGYLPSEGDYIAGANHLKEIFKDENCYSIINGKALITSTEPTGTAGTNYIRTIGFTSWTTVQNGTAACIGINTMKFTVQNGTSYATLAFKKVTKTTW